jgi:hypothetical protein
MLQLANIMSLVKHLLQLQDALGEGSARAFLSARHDKFEYIAIYENKPE